MLVVAHMVLGLTLLGGGRALGRRSFLLALVAPALGLVWAVAQLGAVLDGHVRTEHVRWVDALRLSLTFRLDAFSLLFVGLVAAIGALVLAYATQYFAADRAGLHRLAGLLLVFMGAMFGVVTAANLLALYVWWELTSVSSYLLIGWTDADPKARASALQALLTTGAGGLAMLGGFLLIGQTAGTYDLAMLAQHPPSGTAVNVGLVLVLVGACTKSAQFPFSAWLPGAMVAPTPVSALLHSATMVKAGVYVIARFSPMFADQGAWRVLAVTVGLTTMLTAGWRALRQYDLKRILAYGTVSQLGFMVVLFGAGTPEATLAGVTLLLAHALFKAGLFLVVGIVDHQAHTRDIRALGRFGPGWHGPRVVAVVSGASMAGIPLLFGFIAKESAYDAWSEAHLAGSGVVLAGLVVGSMLTLAYTARLLLGMFVPGVRGEASSSDGPAPVDFPPPPRRGFWAPAAILGAATALLGLAPGLASELVGAAATSLDPRVEEAHLAIWHGFSTALVLSGVTILGGAILVGAAPLVSRLAALVATPFDGDAAYLNVMRGVNLVADRITGILQNGSLPTYIAVILTTVVAVPGYALLHAPMPDMPALVSGPGDWIAAALMVVGGTYAAIVRERMAAVLCLGAVGYGMALMFVLQGAPDLALTQVCVDTIGAVIFVLVLRQLPNWFSERPTVAGRTVRLVVSGLVGVFVFAFIVVAGDVRVDPPVSQAFLERALPEGGGRNVVNVVLVDIRGFDTMGEITVLAVAAMGSYSIARLSRRDRHDLGSRAARRRRWLRRDAPRGTEPATFQLEENAMEIT